MKFLMIGALAGLALSANANLLTNGSFEVDAPTNFDNADGGYTFSASGWTPVYGYSGSWAPILGVNTFGSLPDGVQAGFTGGDNAAGQMLQDTGHILSLGETVSFSVEVGHRANLAQTYNMGGQGYAFVTTTDGFFASGSWLTAAPGTFGTVSTSFVVDASLVGRELRVLLGNNAGNQASFDNAVLDVAPVPEPATMAALGLGLASLARRRRKA